MVILKVKLSLHYVGIARKYEDTSLCCMNLSNITPAAAGLCMRYVDIKCEEC